MKNFVGSFSEIAQLFPVTNFIPPTFPGIQDFGQPRLTLPYLPASVNGKANTFNTAVAFIRDSPNSKHLTILHNTTSIPLFFKGEETVIYPFRTPDQLFIRFPLKYCFSILMINFP